MAESKISAIIITYNEERNIFRCIDSVKVIADEIIVMDSISTDDTKKISLSNGAKVYDCNWEGYGKAKNYAASKATHGFLLSIDADETLSEELKNSIIVAKRQGLNGVYEFNRRTNYCGKWISHCGWYPDRKIRIYPKTSVEWNNDIVHEELIFKTSLKKTFLNGDLHHYSYFNVEEHWERAIKYAEMGARQDLQRKNNSLFLRRTIGAAAKFLKMYFFQLGFLDGTAGFTICRISAYATYLKYLHKGKLLH